MDREKLLKMVEEKKQEALKKAEERKTKLKEKYEAEVKKVEEKAASVEVDEEKLTRAAEIEEQIKVLQEERKGLGLGRTIGVAKGPRPKSVSGQYKSVREMAEHLFNEDPEIKGDEFLERIKEEFPESRATKNDYNWLKNKIISHSEWKFIK